jgi:hypothetical protein
VRCVGFFSAIGGNGEGDGRGLGFVPACNGGVGGFGIWDLVVEEEKEEEEEEEEEGW